MSAKTWRKGNSYTLLVRMSIGIFLMENVVEFTVIVEKRTTIWSGNSTPGHVSGRDNFPPTFVAAS